MISDLNRGFRFNSKLCLGLGYGKGKIFGQ
jgi:hypothetical protein